MHYLPDGTLIPNLVTEVPTVENGLLGEDLKSVTYKLLDGVTWSDGEPLTADDVVFTYNWVVDPANASVSAGVYSIITSMEVVDPLTVQVNFADPNANWFEPHAGTFWGTVYPKHVLDVEDGKAAHDAFLLNPVGTGPYKVESFSPNDQVIYAVNENYREADKPYFSKVNLKGGGDAASAARAVLQTGDYDYAWNLQVEPDVLAELMQGGKGDGEHPARHVGRAHRVPVRRLEHRGRWAEGGEEHRQPDHGRQGRAPGDQPGGAARRHFPAALCRGDRSHRPQTILTGIAAMTSPNTSWEFNVDKAKQILDEAGWVMDGDVRKKGDVELSITYVTSINPVRQKEQAIIKQALEEIGFKVELRQVDAAVFFDGSPGNEQNINHFYNDLQMYTNNATTPIPVAYMIGWYGGPEGENIAQKTNNWNGQNYSRFQNADYDELLRTGAAGDGYRQGGGAVHPAQRHHHQRGRR